MLTGKRAVFIGGSTGMGLASAKLAMKEGAQVVIAGRSREKLEQAREEMGGQVEAMSPASQCGRPRPHRHPNLRRHAGGSPEGHVCRLRRGYAGEAGRPY